MKLVLMYETTFWIPRHTKQVDELLLFLNLFDNLFEIFLLGHITATQTVFCQQQSRLAAGCRDPRDDGTTRWIVAVLCDILLFSSCELSDTACFSMLRVSYFYQ